MSRIPIHKRKKRKKIPLVDLDITSLLDILVIVLVFLLKNYNASGVVLNISKQVSLPTSESKGANSTGVNLQISPSTIWIDDEIIVDDIRKQGTSLKSLFDQGGMRIIPIFNKLVEKRKNYYDTSQTTPQAKKFSGLVNLIIDKSIKYNFLKKVLHTCAESGYKRFNFVVLGQDQY